MSVGHGDRFPCPIFGVFYGFSQNLSGNVTALLIKILEMVFIFVHFSYIIALLKIF